MGDDPNSGNWQYKYYAALEQLEQKGKQWDSVENLLRKSLSRISLAADGLNDELDEQLKVLRKSIRDGVDHATLSGIIDAISVTLNRLDKQRTKKAVARPAEQLLAFCDLVEWPPGMAKPLKELRRDMERLREESGLAALMERLASLLLEAGGRIAEAEREPGQEVERREPKGLLGRLFGRETRPQAADEVEEAEAAVTPPEPRPAVAPSPPVDPVAAERALLTRIIDGVELAEVREHAVDLHTRVISGGEAELQRLTDELLALFNRMARPAPASPTTVAVPTAEHDDQNPRAGEVLLQLIERLALPEELSERAERLKEQILQADGLAAWKPILEEIAELVSIMRSKIQRERHDIEAFLAQITSRLEELDQHLQGTSEMRAESLESSREMSSRVQEQVDGIGSAMATADDLDLLKRDVQQRIDTILRHVDSHQSAEEQRSRELEAQIETMQGRMRELEQESGELRGRIEQERSQAATDALTGINNRMAFDERIEQEFSRWKRFKEPLSLVVLDVDFFKRVNDTYGHKAGDKVLVTIAGLLGESIRETDFLARYGGEEFVVIMPGADAEAAHGVAEKLRSAVEGCGFHYQDRQVPVTISCGIGQFHSGDDPERVFERADAALYRAKEGGRNRCEIAK